MRLTRLFIFASLAALLLAACGPAEPEVLRLATTTSTADSGLLEAILPVFEAEYGARVDVVAVGTGQAITIGESGDADVILVHARSREDTFIADGHALSRADVMYNDFVLVGPPSDPAQIAGLPLAAEALTQIAQAQAPFASRGDDSGTHTKELFLWEQAGIAPNANDGWYNSIGQGMGETLIFANELGAYTLADRGTFLSLTPNLPDLVVLVGGGSIDENEDPALLNPYGVLPVNPDKEGVNAQLAANFVAWLTSLPTQEAIAAYGVETFGQPLFYPDSEAWRNR